MKKTVTYLFRKRLPQYHSIEVLFETIINHLPKSIFSKIAHMPAESKGLKKRLANTFFARQLKSDLYHITGDVHYIALLMKKNKTILTIHDLGPLIQKKGLPWLLLYVFWFWMPIKRCGTITVISEFSKNELLRFFPWAEKKTYVIHDCLTIGSPFMPKEKIGTPPVILQIGTKLNKNLEKLIEAITDIECKLVIVGRLTECQLGKLENHNIIYENFFDISNQHIAGLYQSTDLLTFVSTYEGFGLPILEAQSAGLPVLASNIASMPEIAGHGALFVSPYDANEIRNGIITILNDNLVRQRLIANGFENIKRFSPEAIAEKYAQLYHEILGQ